MLEWFIKYADLLGGRDKSDAFEASVPKVYGDIFQSGVIAFAQEGEYVPPMLKASGIELDYGISHVADGRGGASRYGGYVRRQPLPAADQRAASRRGGRVHPVHGLGRRGAGLVPSRTPTSHRRKPPPLTRSSPSNCRCSSRGMRPSWPTAWSHRVRRRSWISLPGDPQRHRCGDLQTRRPRPTRLTDARREDRRCGEADSNRAP